MTIWTIGHSTRTIEDFIAILRSHNIQLIADVRKFPSSRRYPHFNRELLQHELCEAGIGYVHFLELGGRRRPRKDSLNLSWRNDSFRGYADYMETPAFDASITSLMQTAAKIPTVIMCAEAVWWQCHRSLVADYLKANGVEVIHIIGGAKTTVHPYTSVARIVNGKLTYRTLL